MIDGILFPYTLYSLCCGGGAARVPPTARSHGGKDVIAQDYLRPEPKRFGTTVCWADDFFGRSEKLIRMCWKLETCSSATAPFHCSDPSLASLTSLTTSLTPLTSLTSLTSSHHSPNSPRMAPRACRGRVRSCDVTQRELVQQQMLGKTIPTTSVTSTTAVNCKPCEEGTRQHRRCGGYASGGRPGGGQWTQRGAMLPVAVLCFARC
eukprot:gene14543-biopygen581